MLHDPPTERDREFLITIYIPDLKGIIVSTNMLSVFLMDIYTVPIKREVFRKNVNSF